MIVRHRLKVFAVLVALIAATSTAFGHAKMVTSVPVDGSQVAQGRTKLEVRFSKPMRITVVAMTHTETQSRVQPTQALPAKFQKSIEIGVPPMIPGSYTVQWTAVATDGHVMDGIFVFTVTPVAPDE